MGKRKVMQFLAIAIGAGMVLGSCGLSSSAKDAMSDTETVAEYSSASNSTTESECFTAQDSVTAGGTPYKFDTKEIEFNTEEYNAVTENGFLSVKTNPLSTFAADVDTASYANLRRMILAGQTVDTGAVRVEEMLNYFHYDYPEPKEGEPFSVTTEVTDCPWNENSQLLLVGLQAAKMDPDEIPPSNLVFLIDTSGSMSSADKLPLVQQAFRLLCESLGEDDRISIVTYASTDEIVLQGASGDETRRIMEAVEELEAGGATAGAAGIQTAYEIAERNFIEGGNNRVILATDGDLNVGISSESQLAELIKAKAKSGVDLSVMGFGTGNLKDNKMEALADKGNGNYSYIDSVAEARKVLFEEMDATLFTVARDVKFQVEFNPAIVSEYRLIGYENRKMADRDFADDTKDGGEIGAGHRVTVLYEIVKTGSGDGKNETDLKYQEAKNIESDEWLTVNVRYKESAGSESRLLSYPVGQEMCTDKISDNLKFAACVAETGMLLRDSEYVGSSSYRNVLEQLNEVEDLNQDDYKDEFHYLVKKLAKNN